MKILQVNQYYYPRGGADKYFLTLSAALEAAGHEVAVFSMQHPKNLATPWSRYFVSRISFNDGGLKDKLKTPGRVLYSQEAKKKFTQLLQDFQPDIIHCHNIYHHLSPSLLAAAKKQGIPVVMHLHDYKLICPNHTLFTQGAYCENCRKHKYYQCLKKRCVKNSVAGSALAMVEMYYHHCVLKIYEKDVNLFIAPSHFMKNKVVSFGWPGDKITVLYNPYDAAFASQTTGKIENYLLYFGRLSPEKGLKTLIQAAILTGQPVKIVGEGPEETALKKLAADLKAPVEFSGFKQGSELRLIVASAKAVVLPPIWAENMPLSLMEALSLGKIVIASRMGGLPEVIIDGQNGLLFNPGDANDLARQIKKLADLDLSALSQAARATVQAFSPAKNTAAVLAIYQSLLK